MKNMLLIPALFICSCSNILPGRLSKLPPVRMPEKTALISLDSLTNQSLTVQYLGSGGLYLLKDSIGILIDPFFSNQKMRHLAGGVLLNKRKVVSDPEMIQFGLHSIQKQDSLYLQHVKAIFVAHSHYDHLLDVPAVYKTFRTKPAVFLNESGRILCSAVIDTPQMKLLEDYQTSKDCSGTPIRVGKKIRIYPILAGHNSHLKNIKFFDGSVAFRPSYFQGPYDATKPNDWLEGNTFSFLIDYLDDLDSVELRLFVQSSSCDPMAGIPPAALLREHAVDIAFLGVASYEASTFYPETLLSKIHPQKVVWIHWEDFFRDYDKSPKTIRATNVPRFLDKTMVQAYKDKSWMPWPRTIFEIRY